MKAKEKIMKVAGKIFDRLNSLSQTETGRTKAEKTVTQGMPEFLRAVAADGAVLLKNDGTLPLKRGSRVSVFGRVQMDWFFTGYGSGGDVNKPYSVNLVEGIRNCGDLSLNEDLAKIYGDWCESHPVEHGIWGHWPRCYPEMPLDRQIVSQMAGQSDVAVAVIGRSSGEDRENTLEKGSYYITDEELAMLDTVTAAFPKTVLLLNIGAVIDLSWLVRYGDKIGAVMILWQGGMESGNAAADLLSGAVSPSGKLTDTIVKKYDSYPCAADFGGKDFNNYTEDIYVGYRYFETFDRDAVLYPFGYGLSYSDFSAELLSAEKSEDGFVFRCRVTNAGGKYCGKYAPQLYVKKPCDLLGAPRRELVAFGKTGLLAPGQSQELTLSLSLRELACYDDSGVTGHKSAYVLQPGEYRFALGDNVRDAKNVWSWTNEELLCLQQLRSAGAPRQDLSVLAAEKDGDNYVRSRRTAPKRDYNLRDIILENLPPELPMTGDRGYQLCDVKEGKVTMEDFVSQLSLEELEAISRGDYTMDSPLGAKGNAGCFGGVLPSLRAKGVPAVTTTDGPSGIRLAACCSLMPIGTLLACTFDTELVERLMKREGEEMAAKGSDVLLAPGMNIHRSPLCGRNFEYFSEDPLLSGRIAAAYVRGIQASGRSACPKHFACNNQEYNRIHNDSRLSERALREIYLRGFEICVREAKPKNIMTSYNLINGVWGHYNYELCTMILREEWGYEGNVMTDWWMRKSKSQEFPAIRDQAYRVRAQVDVFMPGAKRMIRKKKPDGTLLETLNQKDGITLGELQRGAMNVLRFVMNSSAMK
ncbi:MAG: glycoside hydrolase family 3 C-terminal domain-containing protein [Oscillospiraceae bacterium]|nr:glycoside hydrolase family 3 C-terminal domain-containing protein [Oscillospiraceae bacterium]